MLIFKTPKRAALALAIAVPALPAMAAAAADSADSPVHMAIAWSGDSDDVWVAWNYGSKEKTEAVVLKDCVALMEQPCEIGRTLTTGVAVLLRQQNGIPFLSEGQDVPTALASGNAHCAKQQSICAMLRVFVVHDGNPSPHRRQPNDMSRIRKKYGAVVTASSATKNRRIHLAAGRASVQIAIDDALANCKTEGGIDCKMIQWGGNTKMVVMLNSKGEIFADSGDYPHILSAIIVAHCKANNLACTEQTWVDTCAEETSFYVPHM